MRQLTRSGASLSLLAGALLAACGAAGTPRVAPREELRFVDEATHGPFVVQRWVNESNPEVSPAGMCECVTVAYLGERSVVTVGDGGIAARSIDPASGRDVNGDGDPDLIVTAWSGGAHCCFTTTVYSIGAEARVVLDQETGDCDGRFEDLDGDGRLEFTTCDSGWGTAYCSFAGSPFPPVVFAYDPDKGAYVPATPRYAGRYRERIDGALHEAEALIAQPGRTPDDDKCAVLKPVLDLMYAGRFEEGADALRRLYRHPDVEDFARDTTTKVRESPLWVAP